MSGYLHCACRDCMDVSITSDGGWTLCELCLAAACTPWPSEREPRPVGFRDLPSSYYECQREDAYEDEPGCEGHAPEDVGDPATFGESVYCDGSCVRRQ